MSETYHEGYSRRLQLVDAPLGSGSRRLDLETEGRWLVK